MDFSNTTRTKRPKFTNKYILKIDTCRALTGDFDELNDRDDFVEVEKIFNVDNIEGLVRAITCLKRCENNSDEFGPVDGTFSVIPDFDILFAKDWPESDFDNEIELHYIITDIVLYYYSESGEEFIVNPSFTPEEIKSFSEFEKLNIVEN